MTPPVLVLELKIASRALVNHNADGDEQGHDDCVFSQLSTGLILKNFLTFCLAPY